MQSDWIKQSEDTTIETITIDSFKVHSNSMTSRWLSMLRVLLAAALEQAKQIYIKTQPQTKKTGKEINPDFEAKANHMIDTAEAKVREVHAKDIKDGGLLDPAKKIGLADTEIIDELLLQVRFWVKKASEIATETDRRKAEREIQQKAQPPKSENINIQCSSPALWAENLTLTLTF